jgi:hypothetical protein
MGVAARAIFLAEFLLKDMGIFTQRKQFAKFFNLSLLKRLIVYGFLLIGWMKIQQVFFIKFYPLQN